jgi:hypothetical protein
VHVSQQFIYLYGHNVWLHKFNVYTCVSNQIVRIILKINKFVLYKCQIQEAIFLICAFPICYDEFLFLLYMCYMDRTLLNIVVVVVVCLHSPLPTTNMQYRNPKFGIQFYFNRSVKNKYQED